jgi:hypothetical protein
MNDLFEEYNSDLEEKFEIIFDRAKDEKSAKLNAADYYLCLREEGKHIDIDVIIDIAESYGYDFADFENLIQENE